MITMIPTQKENRFKGWCLMCPRGLHSELVVDFISCEICEVGFWQSSGGLKIGARHG